MKHDSYPVLEFKTPGEFEKFLKLQYDKIPGIWMKFAKKGAGIKTISYDETLEIALCYGWIDGQVKRFDETYYLDKFTPRGPKSLWSKRNVEIVGRLIKEKRMKTPGLEKINAAKEDGRWEAAYAGSDGAIIPEDFMRLLKKDKRAEEFFKTLKKSDLFAIYYRLHTAVKPETRERWMNLILEMMKKGEKFH
jgi:uncharacterized protein YdeI (YjbR/CyaY-like superfamily)